MLIWIIFGSFLVIVAFVVFSLFGFLRQSKVIDFAWGLSYTDSSLIGQVNELFKRELSVGLVKPTVVWNLRENLGINGKNGQWPVGLSRSVWFEISFRSKLVWDFSKPFDFGNSWSKKIKKIRGPGPEFLKISGPASKSWVFAKSIDHFESRF